MKVVVARYNEDIRWILPIIDIVIVYNKGPDDLDYIPQNKIIKCKNIGKEGETYVKHILENYEQLDDYTVFIQGKIYDHIQPNSIEISHKIFYDLINETKTYNFKYISTWNVEVLQKEFTDYCSGLPAFPFDEILEISSSNIINFLNTYQTEPTENVQKLLDIFKYEKMIKKHDLTKILDNNGIGDEPLRTNLFSLYSHEKLFEKIYSNSNKKYTYGSGALFICSNQNIQKIPKKYWEDIYSTLLKSNPPSGFGLEKMWNYLLNDNY